MAAAPHAAGQAAGHSLRRVMRIWVDLTNSPHVLVLRPIVEVLRAQGHEVQITARDFAQTLDLLEDAELEHTVVGPSHGGASRVSKVRAMDGYPIETDDRVRAEQRLKSSLQRVYDEFKERDKEQDKGRDD